jgi:hypothetical protein
VEIVSDSICNYGVTRIVAACTSCTNVSGLAEKIHELAFPLVSELGAKDHGSHQLSSSSGKMLFAY